MFHPINSDHIRDAIQATKLEDPYKAWLIRALVSTPVWMSFERRFLTFIDERRPNSIPVVLFTTSDRLGSPLCKHDVALLSSIIQKLPSPGSLRRFLSDIHGEIAWMRYLKRKRKELGKVHQLVGFLEQVYVPKVKSGDLQVVYPIDDFLIQGGHDEQVFNEALLCSELSVNFKYIHGVRAAPPKEACNKILAVV